MNRTCTRLVLVAALAALAGCRAHPQACPPSGFATAGDSLPPAAYSGAPGAMMPPAVGLPGIPVAPLAYQPLGPWAPPNIPQPWPADEYLRDGGDAGTAARVLPDWEVRGLEVEDTIAHFDTLSGQTLVEPSNRVHLYAPRFGAVRQVVNLVQNEQRDRTGGLAIPERVAAQEDRRGAELGTQNMQAIGQIGRRHLIQYRTRQGDGALSSNLGPQTFQDRFEPFENLEVIRTGNMLAAEMAFLGKASTAAVAWAKNQPVLVEIDRQRAIAVTKDQKAEVVYTVDEAPGCPRLRVIKVASTQFAEPGDTVAFTIRFDNVGNQRIGNVTIMDSLTTRLEYLPNSAQSSLPAQFFTQENEAGSLVLRWEVADPLKPGEGGIVRFACRVR